MYYTATAPPEPRYPPLLHTGGTGGTHTRVFPAPQLWEHNQQGQGEGAGHKQQEAEEKTNTPEPQRGMCSSQTSPGREGCGASSAEKQEVAVSIYSPCFRARQHQGEAILHGLPPRYRVPLRVQRRGQVLSSSSRSPSHPWAEPSCFHPKNPAWLWSARLSPALRETADIRRQTSNSVQDGTRKINSPERST